MFSHLAFWRQCKAKVQKRMEIKNEKAMKKLMSIISMLLLALTATTLVSCDDDSDIATTLEGTWQGKMELITEYQGQSYQVISSEICFVQDPYSYSSGTGYWIDYYQRSPWRNNQVADGVQRCHQRLLRRGRYVTANP